MTQYAYVENGVIEDAPVRIPAGGTRQDTGGDVAGLRRASPELQQACGYWAIQTTTRPDDTPTERYELSYEMIDHGGGPIPTQVWTAVPKSAGEQAAEADAAAREADAADLKNEIGDLKDERDDASASKDDAALEVSEMTEFESDGVTPNPDWKNARWKTLREDWPEDGTITLAEVGEAINDLTKKTRWLQTGQRQQWVEIRKLWGNVRHLTAAFIKKLRKDRDDE